jgi:hypothetical protein
MNPAWVSAVVALSVAIAALLIWLTRILWRVYQKMDSFLEDWNGSPATPGHPARPGVMERLVDLETTTCSYRDRFDSQDHELAAIKSEVTYNSGHSLKDTVRAIKLLVDKIGPTN